MNRPLVLMGVALSAAVVLTGCGGKRKASTVAASVSAKTARPSGSVGRGAMPHASATVRGIVKVGTFCTKSGAVGKTSTGTWARCEKRPGDSRPRWQPQRTAPGSARAGQFCSPAGSTATSSSGKKLVCAKKGGQSRPRWQPK